MNLNSTLLYLTHQATLKSDNSKVILTSYVSARCIFIRFISYLKLKIKKQTVAYSSQGSHTGQLNFCK